MQDQVINHWEKNEKKNTKNQWSQELVLWQNEYTDKLLVKLITKERTMNQFNNIKDENRDITADSNATWDWGQINIPINWKI